MTLNSMYHGSNRVRGERMLKDSEWIISKGDNHWLGDGMYVFTEVVYSYKWIVDMYKSKYNCTQIKYEQLIDKYLILKIDVNLKSERVFDLTNPEHKVLFDLVLKEMKDKRKISNKEMPEGVVINYMFEELRYKEKFDVINALFTLNKDKYNFRNRLGYMPQRQICIRNREVVQNMKEYDFESEIDTYNYVINNMYYNNIIIEQTGEYKYEINRKYFMEYNRSD